MKSPIAAALLAAGTLLAAAAPASAFTGVSGIARGHGSAVTDVGWRCGRGWHWSFRAHRCVRNWHWR